jgi:hypothetical protein
MKIFENQLPTGFKRIKKCSKKRYREITRQCRLCGLNENETELKTWKDEEDEEYVCKCCRYYNKHCWHKAAGCGVIKPVIHPNGSIYGEWQCPNCDTKLIGFKDQLPQNDIQVPTICSFCSCMDSD